MIRINALKNVYILCLITIVLLIIFTPWLVTQGLSFIDEESIEVILIALLFGIGSFIYSRYKQEIEVTKNELINLDKDKQTLEERLEESFKYIGARRHQQLS